MDMDIISLLETPATPTIYNGTGSREVQLHELKKKTIPLVDLEFAFEACGHLLNWKDVESLLINEHRYLASAIISMKSVGFTATIIAI